MSRDEALRAHLFPNGLQIASPEHFDEPHPLTHDLDEWDGIDPGFASIPTPEPREHVVRRNRDATPINTTFPNHSGDEL